MIIMALYAISDLHLPLGIDKPMDIFGSAWSNYVERLYENWQSVVTAEDTVVLPGDFSWATYLQQAEADFAYLHELNGKKILLKGNHDYWWTTKNKMRQFVEERGYHDIFFLQNDAYFYRDIAICGTRGWLFPQGGGTTDEDKKIYAREVQRMGLSCQAAGGKKIIAFLHYPPLAQNIYDTDMIRMLKTYDIDTCVYGHLHAAAHKNAVEGNVDGIEYLLVSGDYRAFTPVKIMD